MARTNQNQNPNPKTEQGATPESKATVQAGGENGSSQNPQDVGANPPAPTDGGQGATSEDTGGDSDGIAPTSELEKEFTIVNPEKANRKLRAVSGKVIEFDGKGNATVGRADAEYLLKIKGYSVKEK